MPVSLLIPLITQVGIPLASQLIALWEKGGTVSSAEFSALIGQTSVSAKQVLINQLNAAGISLTDPHAVSLLAITN
jgi:hypothetical protein